MTMDRQSKLFAVQDAYAKTAKDFEDISDEDEAKIMDAVQTALNKN